MPSAAGIYYFTHEEQNLKRPPVILIHGAGGTHLDWPPQIRRLDGQPLFALDLPGHGKSEGVGRQQIGEYAADILRFMDALKLTAAVLVGHSMGAAIALTLAIEEPGRLLGLALLGASYQLRVSPSILDAASRTSSSRAAVHMVTEAAYSPRMDARFKELAELRMAQTRQPVFYGDFLACDSFNVLERLGRISTHTLVIGAIHDILTPLWCSATLAEHIPGARLQEIPFAGHMVMLEQPERVAFALSAFFDSLPDLSG